MPLARLLGLAVDDPRPALQAGALADRPEPPLDDGRRDDERRRLRRRLVRRRLDEPGVYHSVEPAWNDRNLRDMSQHISSPLVFAHIRASTGTAVQETNCHPFRHGNWLWQHNGGIREFQTVKRDLVLAVDPSLFSSMEGSTDTEVFFYVALTFGLKDDPPKAVAEAVGFIEEVGKRHGVEHPMQMTVATTDGDRIWAFRYSSERDSRSLFYSTDVPTLRKLHPELEVLSRVTDESRLIVSEPLARPPRCLEPGAGVELRDHPGRPGRAPSVQADGSVAAHEHARRRVTGHERRSRRAGSRRRGRGRRRAGARRARPRLADRRRGGREPRPRGRERRAAVDRAALRRLADLAEPDRGRLLARARRLGALLRRGRRPVRPQAAAGPRHAADRSRPTASPPGRRTSKS